MTMPLLADSLWQLLRLHCRHRALCVFGDGRLQCLCALCSTYYYVRTSLLALRY